MQSGVCLRSGVMPHEVEKREFLAAHPLFGQLTPEELDRLAPYMRLVHHPKDTVLFRKGDPGTSMLVLLRGRVKVCTHSEDGRELVLNLFNPGDLFGEIAFLDQSERSADAVALDDCDLLVLERRDFTPFLQSHPEACMRLLGVLCQRVRRTSQFLEEVLFEEGPIRLAKRLVYLADVFGQPTERGIRIDIPLSQQQLGNVVGMSRESINKQLRLWHAEGLVEWDHGYYTVLDLDALRDL